MAPASSARSDAQSVAATGAQSDRRAPPMAPASGARSDHRELPSALALGVASAADGVLQSGTASVSALVVPSDLPALGEGSGVGRGDGADVVTSVGRGVGGLTETSGSTQL